LIEGAAPVQVRPYRFAPAIKDEIERQIKEMLKTRIIQRSSSPFSSSVLLVKKKDNTWRFCVDYRHLNAITLKSKYPVPIIDEFLDELVLTDKRHVPLRSGSVQTHTFFTTGFPRFLSIRGARGLQALIYLYTLATQTLTKIKLENN
jgi:hypothetical protein